MASSYDVGDPGALFCRAYEPAVKKTTVVKLTQPMDF
jgi:hypothetical protein